MHRWLENRIPGAFSTFSKVTSHDTNSIFANSTNTNLFLGVLTMVMKNTARKMEPRKKNSRFQSTQQPSNLKQKRSATIVRWLRPRKNLNLRLWTQIVCERNLKIIKRQAKKSTQQSFRFPKSISLKSTSKMITISTRFEKIVERKQDYYTKVCAYLLVIVK